MNEIHQDQEVLKTGKDLKDAQRAVILVHGRGATAHGISQLSKQLPEAAYFAPQASNRTWYPERFMEPVEKNQPHLDSALDKIASLVNEIEQSISREKTVLLGFSQGACLVSEFAARNPERYGGIILFSGGLIGENISEYEGSLDSTPVFIGCAENDPHIPLKRVEETERVLTQLDGEVDKYIFEGSYHGIKDVEIDKASDIIEQL